MRAVITLDRDSQENTKFLNSKLEWVDIKNKKEFNSNELYFTFKEAEAIMEILTERKVERLNEIVISVDYSKDELEKVDHRYINFRPYGM